MSDHDPQRSEPSASQPPDEPPESRRPDRPPEGEAGAEPRERRDVVGRSAAQPSGQAVTDRGDRAGRAQPRSLEDIFALVTDRRRRRLLSILCAVNGESTVSQLAAEIEARSAGDSATDGRRRAIEVSLVHDHLPRLASMDLISYDRDRRRVRPTPAFRRIESRLRSLVAAGDRVADE